ncbi:hypothetical protein H1P_1520011 [Hyella patelloides LEGE 07179]|uniref:Uncharacterized protein n=1 Tax=Hyella patelloides LEGE 07179 TaxID=945734 RepID=A0A563VME9_9CYAN|nr:DUF2905 domain-containing protein [Hyella patelloides]VEP12537.1 hypothetical protein H1P_1520011 [Hyella patelloides LEGE 07179]
MERAKNFPISRLPKDILIQKNNFNFYFPLATWILISLGLSALRKAMETNNLLKKQQYPF